MYVETIVAFLNDCMFGSKRRKEIPTYFSGILRICQGKLSMHKIYMALLLYIQELKGYMHTHIIVHSDGNILRAGHLSGCKKKENIFADTVSYQCTRIHVNPNFIAPPICHNINSEHYKQVTRIFLRSANLLKRMVDSPRIIRSR